MILEGRPDTSLPFMSLSCRERGEDSQLILSSANKADRHEYN